LFKFKSKIPDFERGKAKILTTGIYKIFRGLKFEHDAEIGQISADFEKWRFAKVSWLYPISDLPSVVKIIISGKTGI